MYALAALCAFGVTLAAEEASKPAVVQIGADERVVHVVGTPFNHVYYEPRLEALLLQRYACRGLVFREVAAGSRLADLLKDLEGRVMIHRPTLVIIQAGNDDLNSQYRRVTFDFAVYRPPVEEMVKKLRAANVKVILCSIIPRGADGPRGKLNPPNDGLRTWVDAARDIAAKRDAVFVDLFTEAVDWPMINNPKTHYDPEHHRRSWELFARQVHFDPAPGSSVEVDAKGAPPKCLGVTVSDLKTDGGLSFTLQNAAGVGPLILKVTGLSDGEHRLTVGEKVFAHKTAGELATGIDLSACLQTQVGAKEFKEELLRGHKAVAALADIQSFALPAWVKVSDFGQQKQAELQAALDSVKSHDEAVRQMVTPKPLAIRITPKAQ